MDRARSTLSIDTSNHARNRLRVFLSQYSPLLVIPLVAFLSLIKFSSKIVPTVDAGAAEFPLVLYCPNLALLAPNPTMSTNQKIVGSYLLGGPLLSL